jgi:hypothetical protein
MPSILALTEAWIYFEFVGKWFGSEKIYNVFKIKLYLKGSLSKVETEYHKECDRTIWQNIYFLFMPFCRELF